MSEQEKNTGRFSTGMLEQYARGELSAAERHAIEKAALEDPFLADAIEGLENQVKKDPAFNFTNDVLELKKKIPSDRKRVLPVWWQAAAAVLILGVAGVSGYILLRHSEKITTPVIASRQEPKKTTDSVSPSAAQVDVAPAPEKSKASAPEVKKKISLPGIAQASPVAESRISRAFDTVSVQADSALVADKELARRLEGKVSGPSISSSKNKERYVRGQVTDSAGNPVAGASIQWKNRGATTDQNGYYSFYLHHADSIVQVSAVGYQSRKAHIRFADSSQNRIALKPSSQSLNDVVVTGYATTRERELTESVTSVKPAPMVPDSVKNMLAFPVSGWKSFQAYLDHNKNFDKLDSTLHGEEMISFIVAADGRLSDFRIEESVSDAHDAEAERLIRSGPVWKLSKGKKQRASVVIKF